MARCLRERKEFRDEEIVIERSDGSRVWVQANATPYFDDRGELVGAVNVLVDVTERRRAEQEIRRHERELADFFDNATVGLHWVGPDGIILRANRAELSLLGYAQEEYVGRHIAEFHADREVIEDILRRLSAGEELHDYPARLRCKDGSIRHVLISSNVFREGGRFVHTRCFTRDVTDHQRAEATLREREAWLSGQGEALEAALNGSPLEASLGVLVRTATGLLGPDVRAAFYLANPAGTALHHVVGMHHGYAEAVDGFPIGPESLSCGLAVHTGQPILTADVRQEPLWGAWLWLAEKYDFRGCWSIPIHASARQYAGTLAVYWRQPHEATPRDLEVVTRVSQAAGIIISRHTEMEERRRAEEALRRSEAQLQAELRDAVLLQGVSAELIHHENVEALYQKIVDAASTVMQSDFASMQMLYPERGNGGELLLLGSRGFPPEAVRFWTWVRTDSNCTCGIALRTGARFIEPDVANSAAMAGTPDQEALLRSGIRAAQSTPLFSRGGRLLGMITTHWRQPHQPGERDLRLLDVLARQAADLIERRQAEEAERKQAERLRLLWEAAATLLTAGDPDAMLRGLLARIGPRLGVDVYFNYLVTDDGDALRLASCAGVPDETARAISRLEFDQAICGTVAQCRRPIVATHIQESDDPKAQLVKSLGIRAYACNPLTVGDGLLGTLSFASRAKDRFDPDEVAFLETICHYVTVAYERLRLLNRLKEADRRKDEFLATLAHELRNPLAPVRNAVQVLRLKGSDQPDLRWSREVIERQVEHLTRLVDDLLDISRITRNKLELRKQRVELADVVNAAVEASRPLIERCGHELTVTLPPRPVHLEADLVRLSQVVLNLLNNAAKYSERGGRIWLTAGREGSDVVVSVKDTGVGIPAEKLPCLFEMFFQVERSLERAQGGLGIGLSLVRRLVELHGGRVEVRSEGAGKGSEFIVRLPALVESPPAPRPQEPGGTGEVPAAPPRRMLVVDDNRDAADSLAMLLRMTGHEVHVAYDGLAAVAACERLRPEVVLLDIGMPRLNGYDACRRIRAEGWGSGMVLIALTGWGQEEDRSRSAEAGFDGHLTKPVDLTALLQLLNSRSKMPECQLTNR